MPQTSGGGGNLYGLVPASAETTRIASDLAPSPLTSHGSPPGGAPVPGHKRPCTILARS